MPKPLTVWITTNWKILQEMGISDHLTCLLRNLYASQEATVRTRHETMDWFQIGKGVRQSCILSPCLFNFYEDYIMKETLWKVLTNLDSIFKSRDITLPTKVHLVKAMVFPLVMYGCESWTKAQHSENKDHGFWSHQFMGNRWGNSGKQCQTLFLRAPKSLQMVTAAMKLKDARSLEEKLWST